MNDDDFAVASAAASLLPKSAEKQVLAEFVVKAKAEIERLAGILKRNGYDVVTGKPPLGDWPPHFLLLEGLDTVVSIVEQYKSKTRHPGGEIRVVYARSFITNELPGARCPDHPNHLWTEWAGGHACVECIKEYLGGYIAAASDFFTTFDAFKEKYHLMTTAAVHEAEDCDDCESRALQFDPNGPCMGDVMCVVKDGHKTHFKRRQPKEEK